MTLFNKLPKFKLSAVTHSPKVRQYFEKNWVIFLKSETFLADEWLRVHNIMFQLKLFFSQNSWDQISTPPDSTCWQNAVEPLNTAALNTISLQNPNHFPHFLVSASQQFFTSGVIGGFDCRVYTRSNIISLLTNNTGGITVVRVNQQHRL